MPGLANVFFRDIFAQFNGGINSLVQVGSVSGNILTLGGAAPIGKLLFRAIGSTSTSANFSSGSGTLGLYLATGSVTTTMTAISTTLASVSVSGSASTNCGAVVTLDTRNEYFANAGASTSGFGPLYVQPCVVVAGAALQVCLDVLGWECGNDPAKNYDSAKYQTAGEYDAY